MARDNGIGYLEVHLHIPVDTAIQRNKERDSTAKIPVPSDIITKMSSKL
jgi:hypothetical protein